MDWSSEPPVPLTCQAQVTSATYPCNMSTSSTYSHTLFPSIFLQQSPCKKYITSPSASFHPPPVSPSYSSFSRSSSSSPHSSTTTTTSTVHSQQGRAQLDKTWNAYPSSMPILARGRWPRCLRSPETKTRARGLILLFRDLEW
jgi:hypothetical protein